MYIVLDPDLIILSEKFNCFGVLEIIREYFLQILRIEILIIIEDISHTPQIALRRLTVSPTKLTRPVVPARNLIKERITPIICLESVPLILEVFDLTAVGFEKLGNKEMTDNCFVINVTVYIMDAVFRRKHRTGFYGKHCQLSAAIRTNVPVLVFQNRVCMKILSAFHTMSVMPVICIEAAVALDILRVFEKALRNRTHFIVICFIFAFDICDVLIQAVRFLLSGNLIFKKTERRHVTVSLPEIAVERSRVKQYGLEFVLHKA